MDRPCPASKSVCRWLAASWLVAGLAGHADAAFHLFRIQELYSSADGTVQFVELKESSGSDFESFWLGNALTSMQGTTVRTFTFPANLPTTSTASKSVLIATPGFAALAGVTPDYTIPAPFLFPGGGTINYAGVDSVTYAALPTDGVTSVDRNGVPAPNSPTNFAGQSGALTPPAPPPPSVAPTLDVPALSIAGLALTASLIALVALFRVRRSDSR